MKKIFLLCFLPLAFYVRAFPQNLSSPVYEIKTENVTIIIPDSCWQMLEDSDGKWTIDQVSQSPLGEKFHSRTEVASSAINTYWIRFRLKNDLAHEAKIIFNCNPAFLDLYTKSENNSFLHQKSGMLLPWSERDGIKNLYQLPVVIKPGQDLLVYQRIMFDPRVDIPKYIYVGFGFIEQLVDNHYIPEPRADFDNIRQGIFVGICLLAAIFSFFFFITTHEPVYFHASMTYLLITLFKFFFGFLDIFFRDHPKIIFYSQYLIIPLWLFFLVSTIRHGLNTKRQYPRWDKLLRVVSILPLTWIVAQYFFPWIDRTMEALSATVFVPVIITCLLRVPKINKTAQLLVAGVLLTGLYNLIGLVAFIFNIPLPNWWKKTESDVELIFTLCLIIVSTWLLFERYKQLQKKLLQEAFEKEQLAKEKEIERRQLIEQQKLDLEKQVTERTAELKQSLENLKSTQAQLIQQEKMASLGELTAGIAHEIQNPLNFVNNFSEVNRELIDEMQEQWAIGNGQQAIEMAKNIRENGEKILHHGQRADAIVKGMLQHSRTSSGQKETTDINTLVDEYLRLAYHGFRAKDKSFNAKLKTSFDESVGQINIVPQDIGRVMLNLVNNAFHAVNEKQKESLNGYNPTVTVTTTKQNAKVEITVKDNGGGIPQNIIDKIFQPFFTTKPTGQGTGLGLSLAYDIVKAHGGEIVVESNYPETTTFKIIIPQV